MIDLDAIRARDRDYDDVFEAQAHRLVAWPVHDRRALLAEVDRLREVFASGASTMAQATDEIERLRDWQRRAVQSMRWHAHCEVCAALVAEVGAP